MKPVAFEYHRPRSLEEVLSLRSAFGDDSVLLAGGQSLVPMLNLRLARPEHVIDLGHVEGLDSIMVGEGSIEIGAMVTQWRLEHSKRVGTANPLLRDALHLIGHPQTRARGTVVGSITHADPAGELPAVAVALGGVIKIAGPSSSREVPATEFLAGSLSTTLEPDEVVTTIRLPCLPAGTGGAIAEVSRRRGDFAIVGAVSVVSVDTSRGPLTWRIALFGVGGTPEVLQGEEERLLGEEQVARVGADAAMRVDPASNIHGSGEYRRHLVRELIDRTLRTAQGNALRSTG
jgi:aerobic carbon-monoxide dehydrogenase medium subunit